MTPAVNVFESWDLPRLHPGKPTRSPWLKMKAFGLCLPYRGSTKLLCFRFSDGFSGFWPKRDSEHSQTQFYQVYWVKTASVFVQSHKLEK